MGNTFLNLSELNKERIKEDLILEIDNIIQNILKNLADSYPQAPISGGTPKMRKIIVEVNRVDDPENDFIYRNKIPIESEKSGEY